MTYEYKIINNMWYCSYSNYSTDILGVCISIDTPEYYKDFVDYILKYGIPIQISFGNLYSREDVSSYIKPSKIARFIFGYALNRKIDLAYMCFSFNIDDKIENELVEDLFSIYYRNYQK